MHVAQAPDGSQRTSGLAIASLALSCATVVLGPFGCIPGIICGHIARSECRNSPDVSGDGIALAGLMIGYFFLIVGVLLCLVVGFAVGTTEVVGPP